MHPMGSWRRTRGVVALVAALLLAGASPSLARSDSDSDSDSRRGHRDAELSWFAELWMDVQLRGLLEEHDVEALRDADFQQHDPAKVELGRLLFFDKILSGNRDISCATCHHPLAATADGLSLPAGVGGHGLSTARAMGPGRERVPRNAPDVFNRGHASFRVMFWDGRVAGDPASGFVSPAGADLPPGLESALAVQAMFPVTSRAEMRGELGESELGNATTNPEIWELLMLRLLAIDEYAQRFAAVYPGVPAAELGFQHAANAIAAFEAVAWRADDSPFDRYLRGDRHALSQRQKRGALLFYGKGECGTCHSGPLQTDLDFHAIGMAQLGPGKGDGLDGDEDFGREMVTGAPEDLLKFRTPSLRNAALTGPWGHAGTYGSLEATVRQHLNPRRALRKWDPKQVLLPYSEDHDDVYGVMEDRSKRRRIARASEIRRIRLDDAEVDLVLDFLHALTDPASLDLRADVPLQVPSGDPLGD